MSFVTLGLGESRFGVSGKIYQKLKHRTAARWPSAMPIGGAPIYQHMGPGEELITLSGVIYPEWTPGIDQLRRIRDQCRSGFPSMLVSGLGEVFGRWILLDVDADETNFNKSGMPRKIEFELNLAAAQPAYSISTSLFG